MKINFSYLNYFRPNSFVKSISEINTFSLKRSGIKYVFCDLDNTLIPHFNKLPNSIAFDFVNNLHENDIKIIVISNNSKKRVEKFCDNIYVDDFVYNAKKPFTYKIKKIIKKYNIALDDVIIIGDQFITDIWVANRLGVKSILVLPITESTDYKITNVIVSFLDRFIYRYIAHENLLENKSNSEFINEEFDVI